MRFVPNKPGQSLTEYALPMALVVIVGVGLLGALGTQLNDMFGNTLTSKSSPRGAVDHVIQSGFDALPNSNNLAFDILQDGKTIHFSIPSYPDSLKSAVETVGTDGTTQNYAMTLKLLADKLEQEGVLTPDKAQLIREIANSGFQLSGEQTEVQQALVSAPQNGDRLLFTDTRSNSLVPVGPIQWLRLGNPTSAIQMNFEKAKSGGALNNPIIERLVQDSVNNLTTSGNFSSDYLLDIINNSSLSSRTYKPGYSKSDLDNFLIRQSRKMEAGKLNSASANFKNQAQGTALESSKICDFSGKSKVQGLSCQPLQPKDTPSAENSLLSQPNSKPAPSRMGNLSSDFNFK
jgi:Flp pilus assembly pilin Flp